MKTIKQVFLKYKAIIALLMILLTLGSCEKSDNFDDRVPDYTNAIIQSFKVGDKYAEINHTLGTITATLPAGTDLTKVKPEIRIPDGATISPSADQTFDFTKGAIVFEIKSSDGANRKYTVSLAVYGNPKMLSFGIADKKGVIDDTKGTVAIEIGSQDGNVNNLAPTFVIAEGTTVDVASGVARNFTSPAVYTILSNNGYTAKQYTVTVTQIAAPRIDTFTINGVGGIIDNQNNTINVTLPPGTAINALTPVITAPTGQTVSPASGVSQDFSKGTVEYTVTNTEKLTKKYTVKITLIAATKIAFLGLQNSVNELADDDAKAAAIYLQSVYGNDFKYVKISDISADNMGDVKVAMIYYLTPAENLGFFATPGNASTMLPPELRTGAAQAEVLKSFVKRGGDMFLAGEASALIFSLGRIPTSYAYTENGCSAAAGCIDHGHASNDHWGLGMRDLNNSGNRRNHPIFNGLTFLGGAGDEYLPLQNSDTREVRLVWWPHFDGLLTPSCCGQDAATKFENTFTATKFGTLKWIGDAFGYGAIEWKRTDLTNAVDFDTRISTNYKGHIFTMEDTITGYEWDSNGGTNDYQSNIKKLTTNIIDYLYSIQND
ncbi:DUF5018 domain-containing protein [Flavobacterium aquiphilum]|uniref:DUF5018 domain-containing protein n=1 Tax=Flavobacterium aquiphilum TaxID=3003261 RepID=UPI00247FC051|nr:hypothetical protein [Flavobacterium aquiphilum]